jgi:hypothetical protein
MLLFLFIGHRSVLQERSSPDRAARASVRCNNGSVELGISEERQSKHRHSAPSKNEYPPRLTIVLPHAKQTFSVTVAS